MTRRPVVFVHGLWMHSGSWAPWGELSDSAGYRAAAPGWPGDGETPEATRKDPAQLDNRGIAEVTDHYAEFVSTLPMPPIVIERSFGGLIAQKLLGAGFASTCVRAAYRIQRRNKAVTELVVFADRGHSMPADHGWRAVADSALRFLGEHAPAVPAEA
ncbi:alpha/beta hydrolase [Nocardia asiatica]|uniref:alpha/beta hydrolase n=1 Tax=Nocardia asiatica TaxID=209252 RepID=UPI0024574BC4|nr:alpha/beta fold hydrolase [Nocardia asiatica]